jgi:hypothetical protein
MVPFDADFVPDIDLAARRVVVAPPDGLLDPTDDSVPAGRGAGRRSDGDG